MISRNLPRRKPLAPSFALFLSLFLLGSSSVRADTTSDSAWTPPPLTQRPHTVAVIETGVIVLPTAPISSAQRGGSTPFGTIGKGDATIQAGLRLLYRIGPRWGIGAGALVAPHPTTDGHFGGATGLSRTHSRSYLSMVGEVRYYPLVLKWFEAWVGAGAGAIILADRFSTNSAADVPTVLGSKTTTIRSEGVALSGGLGFDWTITDRWVLGVVSRYDRWILPKTPRCSAILDCATLHGGIDAIEFGITVGYRIPL